MGQTAQNVPANYKTMAQDKKKVIIRSFIQLINQRGYENVRMIDVARASDTSRSTVYRHFPSKVDILIAFHDHIFKHIQLVSQKKGDWLAEDPPQTLVNLFTLIQHQYSYRPLYTVLGNEAGYFTRELRALLVDHFEAGLRKSFAPHELSMPITYLARSLVGLFLEMFLWFCEAPDQHDVISFSNHIHQSMQSVIKQGIRPPILAEIA